MKTDPESGKKFPSSDVVKSTEVFGETGTSAADVLWDTLSSYKNVVERIPHVSCVHFLNFHIEIIKKSFWDLSLLSYRFPYQIGKKITKKLLLE